MPYQNTRMLGQAATYNIVKASTNTQARFELAISTLLTHISHMQVNRLRHWSSLLKTIDKKYLMPESW